MSRQFLSAVALSVTALCAAPPLPEGEARGGRALSSITRPPLAPLLGRGAVSHRLTERAERHNTQQGYKT